MLLGLVGGYLHGHNKVGGVAGGGEGATTVAGLVDWSSVGGLLWDLVLLTGL